MISRHEVTNFFSSLLKLLQEEKQALLQNQGEKVAELVERKKGYIDKLAEFKGMEIENNKKVMSVIEEINSVQEVNLLLTRQALSFQNALLESMAKNAQKMAKRNSPYEKYDSSDSIKLLDQSV